MKKNNVDQIVVDIYFSYSGLYEIEYWGYFKGKVVFHLGQTVQLIKNVVNEHYWGWSNWVVHIFDFQYLLSDLLK